MTPSDGTSRPPQRTKIGLTGDSGKLQPTPYYLFLPLFSGLLQRFGLGQVFRRGLLQGTDQELSGLRRGRFVAQHDVTGGNFAAVDFFRRAVIGPQGRTVKRDAGEEAA